MAAWLHQNSEATWKKFRAAFLQRHPGKPPKITRQSWNALSMHNCGGYHDYLAEFNKQRAMISTGGDEMVETFLNGLNASLRSTVEFNKHRRWRPSEFDKLVHATTERVNNTAISCTGHQPFERRSNSRAARPTTSTKKRERSAGPRLGGNLATTTTTPRSQTANVGRSREETLAIGEYCRQKRICKCCRSADHHHSECKNRTNPPRFQPPTGWDQGYWLRQYEANNQRQPGGSNKKPKK